MSQRLLGSAKSNPFVEPLLRGPHMVEYRFFLLDGDGERTGERSLGARDDADAIDQLELMQIPEKCELWERARFVLALPGSAASSSMTAGATLT